MKAKDLSRKEVLEAYDRLKKKAGAEPSFVIQCPNAECGNADLEEIQHMEKIPSCSGLKIEDGVLFIDCSNSELYFDGAEGGGLECQKCGAHWEIPTKAQVEWE